MRSWHDWTPEEKEFFECYHRKVDKSKLELFELAELHGIEMEMFCRPLDENELLRVKEILDALDAGILSKEAC